MNENLEKLSKNIVKLYDNGSYLENYGSQIFITLIVIFSVLLYYLYLDIKRRIYPIKNNWNANKCNPIYIPFAGYINAPKGSNKFEYTFDNFYGCMTNIFKEFSLPAFNPLWAVAKIVIMMFQIITTVVNGILFLLSIIRKFIEWLIAYIYGILMHMLIPIQKIIMRIQDTQGKSSGIIYTILFLIWNFVLMVVGGMLTVWNTWMILYAWAGVILVVPTVFMFFLIAYMTGWVGGWVFILLAVAIIVLYTIFFILFTESSILLSKVLNQYIARPIDAFSIKGAEQTTAYFNDNDVGKTYNLLMYRNSVWGANASPIWAGAIVFRCKSGSKEVVSFAGSTPNEGEEASKYYKENNWQEIIAKGPGEYPTSTWSWRDGWTVKDNGWAVGENPINSLDKGTGEMWGSYKNYLDWKGEDGQWGICVVPMKLTKVQPGAFSYHTGWVTFEIQWSKAMKNPGNKDQLKKLQKAEKIKVVLANGTAEKKTKSVDVDGKTCTFKEGDCCFGQDTNIPMLINNEIKNKKIIDIKPGDILADNSIVTATFKTSSKNIKMYKINNTIVSENHPILYNNTYIKVKDHPKSKSISYKLPYLYCINTSSKIIKTLDNTFLDWDELSEEEFTILKYRCKTNSFNIKTKYDLHKWLEGGFYKFQQVTMNDKTKKNIFEVEIGDILENDTKVLGIAKIYLKDIELYYHKIDNNLILSSNNIPVKTDFGIYSTIYTDKTKSAFMDKEDYLYNLITDKKEFKINNIVVKDYNGCLEELI